MTTNQMIVRIFGGCIAGIVAIVIATPVFGNPINGVTDDCTLGGIILEQNFFGIAKDFTVHITDKDNGGQEVMAIHAGVITAGGVAVVNVPPPGNGIMHCDAFNTSVAVGPGTGGPGGVGLGAQQELKIEALFTDSVTHKVIVGSIFDFVGQAYPAQFVVLPDLWADTNGNGAIGAGDLLYSLVDLNAYTAGGADLLADVNSRFVPGQQFSIVNGQVAGLPGMLFSTTSFTFDATNGYQGTPYTGIGFAVTDHEVGSVPEPSSLAISTVAIACFVFATIVRRRSRWAADGQES